jgi:hypothetical protein
MRSLMMVTLITLTGCAHTTSPPSPLPERPVQSAYQWKRAEVSANYPRPYVGQSFEDFNRRWARYLRPVHRTESAAHLEIVFQVATTDNYIGIAVEDGVITEVSR